MVGSVETSRYRYLAKVSKFVLAEWIALHGSVFLGCIGTKVVHITLDTFTVISRQVWFYCSSRHEGVPEYAFL